jgi:hypothetical protein
MRGLRADSAPLTLVSFGGSLRSMNQPERATALERMETSPWADGIIDKVRGESACGSGYVPRSAAVRVPRGIVEGIDSPIHMPKQVRIDTSQLP